MIDLLYVAFNRFRYTVETLEALIANTDWDQVRRLYVHDDGSTDGTAEYLDETLEQWWTRRSTAGPYSYVFHGQKLGGPVAAMNWYLDHHAADRADVEILGDAEIFGKIDNDMVVCPGWLPEMLKQMTLHPSIDIVGMEPFLGDPARPGTVHRDVQPARHIGGKGLIRHRAFGHCRMVPGGAHGYQGFTQWQEKHEQVQKAWIKPDLPVFGLDQLPFGEWPALSARYTELGWHRAWPPYHVNATDYWAWWTPVGEGE